MTVSVKRHLSGQNIFPVMLNSCSTGLENAETQKILLSQLAQSWWVHTCH